MPGPRSAATIARQQAGWWVRDRRGEPLDRTELLQLRMCALYSSLIGAPQWAEGDEAPSWSSRIDDLRAAADVAGLVLDGNGWDLPGRHGAPAPGYDHPTMSAEVLRRGRCQAAAILWTAYGHESRRSGATDFDLVDHPFATTMTDFT